MGAVLSANEAGALAKAPDGLAPLEMRAELHLAEYGDLPSLIDINA